MAEKYAEWPELERFSDVPIFNMKAMVQQSGVAAPTLRAWERRYAILSPERAQNAYRLYSERDVAIIRWLKERVDAGMSISQAVSLFRHFEEEQNKRRQPVVHAGEQEGEQMKKGIAPTALQNVPKLDALKRTNSAPATYSMHVVQDRLLVAFNGLDEATASQLLASTLAIYPVEQVCAELITPTLWEIGRLWEQGQISVSVEHFASAFFHGLLTNLFHAMPPGETGPLILFCCAPGEEHELAPLMLSLLLRRAGLHVAYLGQNIEINGLLQTIRQSSPVLVCISATLLSCLEGVAELGQQVQELLPPRPVFIFGGQALEQHPDLIVRIPGVYLDGDLQTVIAQLKRMALQRFEDEN